MTPDTSPAAHGLVEMFARHPARSGVVIGALLLPLHLVVGRESSEQLAALTIVLIAGIYLGFAVLDGRTHALGVEAAGAAGYVGAAWFGLAGWGWAIPVVLALHAGWDLLHHPRIAMGTSLPRWYGPWCAIVDLTAALGLAIIWWLFG